MTEPPDIARHSTRRLRVVPTVLPDAGSPDAALTDTDRPDIGRRHPAPRSPAVGLPLLVLLSLVAWFAAWVSAEPLWIAVGHHDSGSIQVTDCTGQGAIGTRCVGTFTAQGGAYQVALVSVSGAGIADREVGRILPAQMVSERGRIGYAGDSAGLHLRWLIGLGLLLMAGLGIAAGTGAWRLRSRARIGAVTLSLLIPIILSALVLTLSY